MSRLDLTSSFWQIPLEEGSRKYTAFLYKNKCYQFRVVPFGLSTSLAAIVKCLELALGTEVEDFVNIFVDDILIVSRSYEEHLEHLDIVLKKLGNANLVLNKEKCEFFQTEVKFLGHIITPEGIRTDPEKINSITNFPTPNKTKDIRAFLGLTGYYRRFSQKYSETIAPLLDLLKKNQKWRWEPEHERAFKGVKQIFQKDLHLFHPEEGATYVLYTDASDIAIGGVLYQRMANTEHKVIAYVNRTLKGAEKNYFTSEKEILAVVYALGKFRYYLYGKPFEIHSDNQSLSFMLKSKLGNARMTRWVMAIQEYDFVIKYCKAADNQVADVLSRYPPTIEERHTHRDHDVKILAIQYNIPQDLKQRLRRIQTEQRLDPSIRRTMDQIVQRAHPRYIIHQDILYKWMEDKWRVVLPQHMVEEVTWACHESLAHAGAYRCYLALREDFVWNNMARKIKSTLRTCHQCQTARYPNQHTYVEMGSIVTKGKGEILCLDFLGPLPRASRGNRHLIVCTDAFTKFVKLYPVNRPTTQSVLNAVLKKYIPECGPVKRILTDQGKQFQNKAWADTLTRQGIQPVLTSIRRPQGNLAERVNKELGKLFRIYCNRQHSSWPQFVKLFEEAINNSHNVTTGYPPIELHTGSKPKRMWDKYITRLSSYNVPIPIQVKCQDAGERIRKTADQRAQRFREQHKLVKFAVGERVLLRAANVGKGEDNTATKFFPLYRGPFTLTEQVGKNTFLVYNENNQKCIGKYHGSQLRKYYGRPEIVDEN